MMIQARTNAREAEDVLAGDSECASPFITMPC
jgi:hypothetical protein